MEKFNKNRKRGQFDKDDTYGVFKKETEVDSDVNEDPNRERQLDDSIDAFLNSSEDQ